MNKFRIVIFFINFYLHNIRFMISFVSFIFCNSENGEFLETHIESWNRVVHLIVSSIHTTLENTNIFLHDNGHDTEEESIEKIEII